MTLPELALLSYILLSREGSTNTSSTHDGT